jgi:hypothetical protein
VEGDARRIAGADDRDQPRPPGDVARARRAGAGTRCLPWHGPQGFGVALHEAAAELGDEVEGAEEDCTGVLEADPVGKVVGDDGERTTPNVALGYDNELRRRGQQG